MFGKRTCRLSHNRNQADFRIIIQGLLTSLDPAKARRPNSSPDAAPYSGPNASIRNLGLVPAGNWAFTVAIFWWWFIYWSKKMKWAAVIHTEFTRLTSNPCKKNLLLHLIAIIYAQIRKMTAQQMGSILTGIMVMVANAMNNPNKERRNIRLQFILIGFGFNGSSPANRRTQPIGK